MYDVQCKHEMLSSDPLEGSAQLREPFRDILTAKIPQTTNRENYSS